MTRFLLPLLALALPSAPVDGRGAEPGRVAVAAASNLAYVVDALQARLENLVDGVEEPDPEVLRTMLVQTERLGRLVTQLLDLSRLESGTVPLDRTEFAVAPLIEHAVREQALQESDVAVAVVVSEAVKVLSSVMLLRAQQGATNASVCQPCSAGFYQGRPGANSSGACLRCVFEAAPAPGEAGTCETAGVL